jgi:geranylgeranylglycerol-phosphate geranylgeranyltransferase
VPALVRLVHPFPSGLNAVAVLAISLVADGSLPTGVLLACAMLGLQFCIGAVNDLFDAQLDALSKPSKPIPAGEVGRRSAWLIAGMSGGAGVALSAAVPWPDVLPVGMAVTMLGAGLAYDAWLKSTALGWLCFAVALPVLPLYAWYGATGLLPPNWQILLPVAALAGPALHLSNGLIDLESDARGSVRTLVVRLGRRHSIAFMAAAVAAIHVLAWLTISASAPPLVPVLAGVAGSLALGGIVASAQSQVFLRQVGWTTQATSVAILAVAWLLGAAGG